MKIRNRNVNQVSNRYKTLMRSYKQVVDNNKKTGSVEKTHAYENELGEVQKIIQKLGQFIHCHLQHWLNPPRKVNLPLHLHPLLWIFLKGFISSKSSFIEKKTPASTPTSVDNTSNASEETPDSDPPLPKKGTKRQAPSFELSTYLNEESPKQKRFKEFLSKMETMHKEKLKMFRDIFGQKKWALSFLFLLCN